MVLQVFLFSPWQRRAFGVKTQTMQDVTKSPRLYHPQGGLAHGTAMLEGDAHHYLKNVMRVQTGEMLRLFNEAEGEYAGAISAMDKKSIQIDQLEFIRAAKTRTHKTALLIPPLKKERMDMVIEKAVELDVTDIYPVLTQNTDVRKINEERLIAQIIEAAEQCERMDIPTLHPLSSLKDCLAAWDSTTPIYAGIERTDAPVLRSINFEGNRALLIGPAGGFSEDEKNFLIANNFIVPVSLGHNILRAETAAIAGLAMLLKD